jgi:hypothetical protein
VSVRRRVGVVVITRRGGVAWVGAGGRFAL